MIKFKNVCKNYENGKNTSSVLSKISFEISRGEYILITGKSGSGKSTLLNILTGIDDASSGEVIENNIDILKLNEKEKTLWRGENVGIIFQFFQLIPTLSVLENILLPMDVIGKIPKNQKVKTALKLLEMVGLSEHSSKTPTMLSGGEQQRVAIARALANDADLIVADEPTGNLDTKNADIIFDIFNNLKERGKTIVMVTHEKDIIKGATRRIVLQDGKILDNLILKGDEKQWIFFLKKL